MAVDDKAEVKQYFNNEGFDRLSRIYSEDGEVNSVQLDIRTGHAQTVDKVIGWVDADGTGKASDEQLAVCAREIFPTKPAALINHLGLLQPIYQNTAAYGHFGRTEFTWENVDKVDEVQSFFRS